MDWSYIAGYFDGEGHVHFKAAPSRPDYILIYLSWSNNHRGSLEAMQEFMGCGFITNGKRKNPAHMPGHALVVAAVEDILRVGEALMPHLLIKQEALQKMMTWARDHRTARPDTWGLLTTIGVEEITRLNHDEGLTQREIAEKLGVSSSGVSTFFLRNGINGRRRGPAEGAYGILTEFGYDKLQAMYEQGMTIAEIAKEVGVQYGTVYMHFFSRGIRLTKRIRRARDQRKHPSLPVPGHSSSTTNDEPLLLLSLPDEPPKPLPGRSPLKGTKKSPETLARMKAARAKLWEDPAYAERMRKQLLLGHQAPHTTGWKKPSIQGENHPRSKITNEETADIRARYAAGGISMQALANEKGVSEKTIFNIVHEKIRMPSAVS